MKITIDTSATIAELDAMVRAIRAARPDWVGGVVRSVKSDVEGSMRIASEDRPDTGAPLPLDAPLAPGSNVEPFNAFKAIREGAAAADPLVAMREAIAKDVSKLAEDPSLKVIGEIFTAVSDNAASNAPPPPPPPAPAPGVAVDKTGLPWDSRIHSETKATLKDGTWRQRRGVSAELVKTIETQLRAAMAAPVIPAAAAPVTTQAAPPPLPSTPAAPPAPPAPAAPLPGGPSDAFTNLILFITKHKKDGKLNDTQVKLSLEALQMPPSIPLLANRPDLIPALMAKLQTVAGV